MCSRATVHSAEKGWTKFPCKLPLAPNTIVATTTGDAEHRIVATKRTAKGSKRSMGQRRRQRRRDLRVMSR